MKTNSKLQLVLTTFPNKTRLIRYVFTPYQLFPSTKANPYEVIRSKIISSTYSKIIEVRTIPHNTEPVGTVT